MTLETCIRPKWWALIAQGLAYTVHLIVVPAIWEREKLILEISKLRGLLRKEHLTVQRLRTTSTSAWMPISSTFWGRERAVNVLRADPKEAPGEIVAGQEGMPRWFA